MGALFALFFGKGSDEPGNERDEKNNVPAKEEESEDLKQVTRTWTREQMELKEKLILEDCEAVQAMRSAVESDEAEVKQFYVGGVDISFVKEPKEGEPDACAALVVLTFPQLEVVYQECRMIQLTAPYIPGFLAFREADPICDLIRTLKDTKPELMPDVVIVDGNGTLHPRGFGLACHVGVQLDMPFMGVGKTLINVQGTQNMAFEAEDHKNKVDSLQKSGDTFPICNADGVVLGKAMRSTDSSKNPIFVSPGHKISLETAVWLAQKCCKFRVPEPVRAVMTISFLGLPVADLLESALKALQSQVPVDSKGHEAVQLPTLLQESTSINTPRKVIQAQKSDEIHYPYEWTKQSERKSRT